MKKIAIAVRTLKGKTGASAIVLEHAKFLVKKGYQVEIFSDKFDKELISNIGAKARSIKPFGLFDFGKRKSFSNKFSKIVKNEKFDLVIGHGDIIEQDIVFLHNIVFKAHELIPDESDKKIKTVGEIHKNIFLKDKFKLCIANSQMMKDDIVNRFKVNPAKIKVVYPGNNLERFSKKKRDENYYASRKELKIKDGDLLVGLITSGNFEKRGIDVFLNAVNILAKEMPNIKILLVGKEKNPQKYLNIIEDEKVKNSTIYIPQTSSVEKLFCALDLFVLPAYIEEFGLVVQEAMAMGLAVLLGENVGAAELFAEHKKEVVFDSLAPVAIAKKIKQVLLDEIYRERLQELSLKYSKTNDWDGYSATIYEEYKKIGLL